MKKLFALLVCVLLVFTLVSCGDDPCQHRDADDNSLCDKCGESYTDGKDINDSTPCQHRDADDNSLCDNCGESYTDGKDLPDEHTHSCTVKNTDSKYLDKAADCENAATYYYSCSCGSKGTTTFTSGTSNGHSYTVKNTDSKYLATAADCENAATYFYSCACGKKGTTTFTYGSESGHSYTVRNTDRKYLHKAADCENAATYFYSCACGKKGTTTFTSGSANGHSYTVKNTDSKYLDKAADCENAATYYYSCSCGSKGTTTFTSGSANGHSYVIQNVDPKYEKTPASEYTPAVYWKSCACGKASTTETFTHGDMLPGYLTYQLSNDSSFYIVSGFVGADEAVSIPHIYDSLPVFGVMANAFKNNTTLKSISMPNSIQEIGSYAFAGCTSLESVSIPTSVKNVSPYTFSGCTSLKTITLHSGIEELGAFAFENCTSLKSITLNEGLKTISNNVFDNCSALEGITIPDTVTTLGNMAFKKAVNLKYVNFSKALKSIGNSTFQFCASLESVELHENITSLGNSTFSDCRGLKTLRILGNLESIGFSTFYDCRSLTSIYFASKTPGDCGNTNYIFYNAGIEGDGITLTIAKDAVVPDGFFTPYVEDNIPKITKIVIEDGNTTVGGFKNYNKLPYLTSIVYPDTITDSAYGAFNNSLWWNNQEIGEVFINGFFYGYKCHCNLATPESPKTENYVDSKCTEDGGYDTVIYCEVCDDELKRTHTVIPEKGHSPKTAVEENRVEATCTEDGHYDSVVYCNRCNDELSRETETLTKFGHSPKTAVEENRVEATCTEDGHYDSVVYCNRCNDELKRTNTVIPEKGHLTVDYAISNDSRYPFNISENQITSTNKTNNSSSTYTITAKCDFILELEYLVSSENNYDWLKIYHNSNEKVKTSGTSKTTFTTISISMNVGDIVTISYSKDSSSSGGSDCAKINILTLIEIEENRVEATCTEDGHYDSVVYCNRCDEELLRTNKTITKLGHSPKTAVEENRVEATCTEDGRYDSIVYCNRCDDELSRQTITIPSAHTPESAVEENRVEATCTEDGYYDSVVYCNRCDEELSRQTITIPVAHNIESGICSECGNTFYVRDGNYIYFGEYPQTIKSNNVTITETQDMRGYYLGSDGFYYAKVVADPYNSGYTFSAGATVTDGATYYFKVEPIRWRILSTDGETALILCDSIIANKAYDAGNNNNYKNSDIRAWLNASFYETAFTELQREIILTTTVDNSAYSTGYSSNPYASENTNDKIFLLSYREVVNSAYGFASSSSTDDTARSMSTSDYSRATGAYMSTSSDYYGNGYWWLRSPNVSGSNYARGVSYGGGVGNNNPVNHSSGGVVPALRIRV